MMVKDFRSLVDKLKEKVASRHSGLLSRQKLGFSFAETFNQKGPIIQLVVADAILKANEALLESDKIRLPIWIEKATFDLFISKMNLACQS